MKRYTIFNLYIRGSNQAPQACHGLAALVKNAPLMSKEAKALLDSWLENSMIEVMLQGQMHDQMEELYAALAGIPELPVAKFNESKEALMGACTVVTFVANERIVGGINYARFNGLHHGNILKVLSSASLEQLCIDRPFSDNELKVIKTVFALPLA